jgi:hypothetical protein
MCRRRRHQGHESLEEHAAVNAGADRTIKAHEAVEELARKERIHDRQARSMTGESNSDRRAEQAEKQSRPRKPDDYQRVSPHQLNKILAAYEAVENFARQEHWKPTTEPCAGTP